MRHFTILIFILLTASVFAQPTVTTPTSTAQRLKSGIVTTSTVQINGEDGDIYIILNGETASDTAELNSLVLANKAIIIISSATDGAPNTFTIPAGVPDGAYNFIATGVPDTVSTIMTGWLTVDNTAPTAPTALDLATDDDSGSSDTDNITNVSTVTITGNTEAGSTVLVYDDGIDAVTASVSGTTWTAEVTIEEGANVITAKSTDVAGNTSATSSGLTITLDTGNPPKPVDLDLDAADDKGTSNVDNITNKSTVTILGNVLSGSTIEVYDDGVDPVTTTVMGTFWIIDIVIEEGDNIITAITKDIAGNTSTVSPSLTITLDTSVPSIPTDLDLATDDDSGFSDTDNITNISTVTITGNTESGSTVLVYDDGADPVAAAVTGTTWTAEVTIEEGTNVITAEATDIAGNISPASVDLTVTLDTNLPTTPASLDLATDDDSGSSDTDNITNISTVTITGNTGSGSTVLVYDDGADPVSATVTGTNWTAEVTIEEGANVITAQATNVAGNESSASADLTVTLNSSSPAPTGLDLATDDDSGSSDTDDITNVSIVTITGNTESGSTVLVYDDGADPVAATVTGTNWTAEVTIEGGANIITAKSTDIAGNESPASANLTVTLDTNLPTTPTTLDLAADDDRGSSDTDDITNVSTATITGTTESGSTVLVYDDGANAVSATVTGTTWTAEVTIEEGANVITAKSTDIAGNESPASVDLTVTLDTTLPTTPTTLDLATDDDSGSSTTDNITNVSTITITGTTESGSTVLVYDDGADPVAVTVTGTTWTAEVTIEEGANVITAKSTDLAGNESPASADLTVTLNSSSPAPTGLDLATDDDSGSSDTDDITNISTVTITGNTESGSTVLVYDEGADPVAATVTGTTWTAEVTIEEGANIITAKSTDIAGNESPASANLTVTLDTNLPTTPTTLDLAADDDRGSSDTDDITNVSTVTITGTTESGSSVIVYDDGANAVSATVTGTTWTAEVTIEEGANVITAKSTDIAGNISPASVDLTVTLDTTLPTTPTSLDLATDDDSGSSTTDNITNVSTITITGITESGSTVLVYDDGADPVNATVTGTTWTAEVTIEEGANVITAKSTDLAGNESPASADLTVTLNSSSPAPTGLDLATDDDSGSSDTDDITNISTVTITGNTESGSTVLVYDEGADPVAATVTGTTWTAEVTIEEGANIITAKSTDIAGNESPTSADITVTLDITLPTSPTTLDLTTDDDSGSSDIDDITNVSTVTITGTTESGSTVIVYDDGANAVSATVTGTTWTAEVTIEEGANVITAKSTDIAGNISPASVDLTVTLDTTLPTTPTSLDLATDDDSGSSTTDNITNVSTITITGTTESGSTVLVYDDGADPVNATVTGTTWTAEITIEEGSNNITTVATDVAGNVSATSTGLTIELDNTAPTLNPVTISSNNSNSNYAKNGDVITFSITSSENLATAPTVTIESQFAIATGANTNWTTSFTSTSSFPSDGLVPINISNYTDIAGNIGLPVTSTTNTSSVEVDNTNPIVSCINTIEGLKDGDTSNATVQSDDEGNIYIILRGENADNKAQIDSAISNDKGYLCNIAVTANISNTITVPTSSNLIDGYYDFVAVDNAGNISDIKTGWLYLDNTPPPAFTITAHPYINEHNNANYSFTLNGSEVNSNYSFTIGTVSDSGIVTDSNHDVTGINVSALSGTIILSVTLTDTVGNVSNIESESIIVDKTQPIADSQGQPETLQEGSTSGPSRSVSSNENGKIYMVAVSTAFDTPVDTINAITTKKAFIVNNNVIANDDYSVTIPNGVVNATYNVYSVDNAGNISNASVSWLTVNNVVQISSVTSDANSAEVLIIGETINFTVNLGTPQLGLEVSPSEYNNSTITWTAANGGAQYVATYTVQQGDPDQTTPLQLLGVHVIDGGSNSNYEDCSPILKTIDAHAPEISSFNIINDNTTYGVGDTLVFSITADFSEYTKSSIIINSKEITNTLLFYNDTINDGLPGATYSTNYTAKYIVQEGDNDVAAGSLTGSVQLQDENENVNIAYTNLTTNVIVDANSPMVTALIPSEGNKRIGDNITLTIVADDNGYTASNIVFQGVDRTADLIPIGSNQYKISYEVQAGDPDISPGNLTASVVLKDNAGNTNVPFTNLSSNNLTVDANAPTIDTVIVPNGTYKVGDLIQVTVVASESGLDVYDVDINDVDLPNSNLVNTTGSTYVVNYLVQEGDNDVNIDSPSNLLTHFTLADAVGNEADVNDTITNTGIIIDANTPVISSMSITDSLYITGDTIWFDILSDGIGYTLTSFDINGYNIGATNLWYKDLNNNNYRAGYIVQDGDNNIAKGSISVLIGLKDVAGNVKTSSALNVNNAGVDADVPEILSINTHADTLYKVGDIVRISVMADASGYNWGEIDINGEDLSSSVSIDYNTVINEYALYYTVTEGQTDTTVLNVNVELIDAAGNKVQQDTAFSDVAIDANSPDISNLHAPDNKYKIGDTIHFELVVNDISCSEDGAQINNKDITDFTNTGINYSFNYTVVEGDNNVSVGNLICDIFVYDIAGNKSNIVTSCINNIEIDAQRPLITGIEVDDGEYIIGDTVRVKVTADNTGYDLYSATVNNKMIGITNFIDNNNNTYTLEYVVNAGDNDVQYNTLSANVTLLDAFGNMSQSYNNISYNNALVDANIPVISMLTVLHGEYKVGSIVTLTVTADGNGYLLDSVNINSVTENIRLVDNGDNTYSLNYTVKEGDNDVKPGELLATVRLKDRYGNVGALYSTIEANTTSINATSPKITDVTITNTSMKIGDVVTATITVTSSINAYSLLQGSIGGYPLSESNFSRIDDETYTVEFTITNNGLSFDNDDDIPVNLQIQDAVGNVSNIYSGDIVQSDDPIFAVQPQANLYGEYNICGSDSVTLSVSLIGKKPWAITIFDGYTYDTITDIQTNQYRFNYNPEGLTGLITLICTQVVDSTNNSNIGTGSIDVSVSPLPEVKFNMNQKTFSQDREIVELIATPSGGVFTGPGVISGTNIFNPSYGGAINSPYQIIYTYTNDTTTCTNTAEIVLIVSEAEAEFVNVKDLYCKYEESSIIKAQHNDTTIIGTFVLEPFVANGIEDNKDNTATIYPSKLEHGEYTIVHSFFNVDSFEIRKTIQIQEIGENGFISITDLDKCTGDESVPLYVEKPSGLNGSYIIYNNNGITGDEISGNEIQGYEFNPLYSVVDTQTLIYKYTTDEQCISTDTIVFIVNKTPEVKFDIISGVCVDGVKSTIFENKTDIINDVTDWSWNFGDIASGSENQSTDLTGSHIYDKSGTRIVTLTAKTDKCVSTVSEGFDFFEQPIADFIWDSECFVDAQTITFTDQSISSDGLSYYWTSYSPEGIELEHFEGANEVDMTFAAPEQYSVKLMVNSVYGCSDSISHDIVLRPTIVLNDNDYIADFENDSQLWTTESENNISSWEYGLLDNGNHGWATNLSGDYLSNESSSLLSVCLDFENTKRPMFNSRIKYNTEELADGFVLQYTADKGATWNRIGEYNDGKSVDWFNSPSIVGNPGGQQHGWTGDSEGWINVKHDLFALKGQKSVTFRYTFGSGNSNNYAGISVDNVFIGEQSRHVLLEHFTNSNSTESIGADNIINNIVDNGSAGALSIQYHTAFPDPTLLNTQYPAGPSVRATLFGVEYIPYTVMDGIRYYNYKVLNSANLNDVIKRSLEVPMFDIDILDVSISGGSLDLSCDITALDTITNPVTLKIAVIEKDVEFNHNGQSMFQNVIRGMIPGAAGYYYDYKWTSGQSARVSTSWDIENVTNTENLRIVAYVQDILTYEIYQAQTNDTLEYGVGIDDLLLSNNMELYLYPNPATDRLNFKLPNAYTEDIYLTVTTVTSARVLSTKIIQGERNGHLNISALQEGVYFITLSDSNGRISTTKFVKIK